MEEKSKKLALNILSGVVGFGVGIALVSMFIAVVKMTGMGEAASMTLFDDDMSALDVSIAFPVIAFIVTIVGGVMLAVAVTMRIKQNKNNNALLISSVVITAVGAILVLVSGIILKNNVEDASIAMIVEEAIKSGAPISQRELLEAAARSMVTISLGVGIYLGFIGGLVSAIAGAMFFLKPFAPSALAVATEAPVTTEAPVAPESNDQNTTTL